MGKTFGARGFGVAVALVAGLAGAGPFLSSRAKSRDLKLLSGSWDTAVCAV